ncbi:hypothetical protein FB157_1366 [Streptomyces sp. BK340]|nr:hypothetical protein FB157_1366 [Streptomyces sp. BK340]
MRVQEALTYLATALHRFTSPAARMLALQCALRADARGHTRLAAGLLRSTRLHGRTEIWEELAHAAWLHSLDLRSTPVAVQLLDAAILQQVPGRRACCRAAHWALRPPCPCPKRRRPDCGWSHSSWPHTQATALCTASTWTCSPARADIRLTRPQSYSTGWLPCTRWQPGTTTGTPTRCCGNRSCSTQGCSLQRGVRSPSSGSAPLAGDPTQNPDTGKRCMHMGGGRGWCGAGGSYCSEVGDSITAARTACTWPWGASAPLTRSTPVNWTAWSPKHMNAKRLTSPSELCRSRRSAARSAIASPPLDTRHSAA